jgi:hypothetical protein
MSKAALALSATLSLAWLVAVIGVTYWLVPPSIWILGGGGDVVEAARSSDIVLLTTFWFGSNLALILRHVWNLRNIQSGASLASALFAAMLPVLLIVGSLVVVNWQFFLLPCAVVAFTLAIFVTIFTYLAPRNPAIFLVIGIIGSAILSVLLFIGLAFLFFCC